MGDLLDSEERQFAGCCQLAGILSTSVFRVLVQIP